jgi:hypothetical protein
MVVKPLPYQALVERGGGEAVAPELGIPLGHLPGGPGRPEVTEKQIAHHRESLALSRQGIGHLAPVEDGVAVGEAENVGIAAGHPINIFYRSGVEEMPKSLFRHQPVRHEYSPSSRW